MSKYLTRVLVDGVALVALGLPILLFWAVGQPFKRGFFCNDESIRYPYKESTIPTWLLYIYTIGIPLVVIPAIEYTRRIKFEQYQIKFYWQLYCELVVFIFGVFASQVLTDIAKYTIGRLRPHFLEACQPNVPCSVYQFNYVESYECDRLDKSIVKDAHLSFMSGHASLSAYCMTYLAIYLNSRLCKRKLGLLKPFIQIILLYIAIYTGFTRISDYKHHWSDVLFGWLNGTIVAILVSKFIAKLFNERLQNFYYFECKSEEGEKMGREDTIPKNYDIELQQ